MYHPLFPEFLSTFSREAVVKGSFDKYAETARKGTATVDDAFLSVIEDWCDLLARIVALRNGNLSQRELNFCVQRTIDNIYGVEEIGIVEATGK